MKRAFLYALIVSLCLCALFGIEAVLAERLDGARLRILLTAMTVAATSVCGLACGFAFEAKRSLVISALSAIGMMLAVLSAVMIFGGIWFDKSFETHLKPHWEYYWKTAVITSVLAVACGHLSLLSLARLADWCRWSLIVAFVLISGVAALIIKMILGVAGSPGDFQLLFVGGIADATISIIIPIFHRLSRSESVNREDSGDLETADIDAEIRSLREKMAELERQKQG